MSRSLLQQGIDTFRSGEKDKAFLIFSDAVKQSPNSAMAWFWLGKTVDEPERKKYCFDRALQIDPDLRSKLHPAKSNNSQNEPMPLEGSDSDSVSPAKKISRRKYYLFGLIGICVIMAFITLGVIGMDKDGGRLLSKIQPNPQQAKIRSITKTPTLRMFPTQTPLPSITHLPTLTKTLEPSPTSTTVPTRVNGSLGLQATDTRLASLNTPQRNPTMVETLQVTPIIVRQLTPTAPGTQSTDSVIPATDVPGQDVALDTTNPVPAGYEDAIQVDFNNGTGPLVLAARDYLLFHFRPTFPLAVSLAKEIHFFLAPEGKDPSPIQVYLWTKDGGWRLIKPHWGDNLVDHPSFYISPTGDTYIAIRNYSTNTTVRIDNASLMVTAELINSEMKTYGKGK
jgi:hypothetical protein